MALRGKATPEHFNQVHSSWKDPESGLWNHPERHNPGGKNAYLNERNAFSILLCHTES